MTIDCDLIARAARAVLETTKPRTICEDAKSPAGDRAINALQAAVFGRDADARALLERYDEEANTMSAFGCPPECGCSDCNPDGWLDSFADEHRHWRKTVRRRRIVPA